MRELSSFFKGKPSDLPREASTNVDENFGAEGAPSQIDWKNYNFPPLLRLYHFNLDELRPCARKIMFIAYVSWILAITVTLFSIVDTIILVFGVHSGLTIVFSIAQFLIIVPATGFGLYWGYKGVGKPSRSDAKKYSILTGILLFYYLYNAVFHFGCAKGFSTFGAINADRYKDVSTGWIVTWVMFASVEIPIWLSLVGMGIFTVYKTMTYEESDEPTARHPA